MLTITPAAWRAIDDLTRADEVVGMRLGRSDVGSISMDLAAGPERDDTVVWSRGTVVFMDREVAVSVGHAVLDLRSTSESAAFFLR